MANKAINSVAEAARIASASLLPEKSKERFQLAYDIFQKQKEEYVYKCPKCAFGFRTLNAVENHVIRCIELDDSLP